MPDYASYARINASEAAEAQVRVVDQPYRVNGCELHLVTAWLACEEADTRFAFAIKGARAGARQAPWGALGLVISGEWKAVVRGIEKQAAMFLAREHPNTTFRSGFKVLARAGELFEVQHAAEGKGPKAGIKAGDTLDVTVACDGLARALEVCGSERDRQPGG
ncbi:hypothetical protein MNEG_5268 [Monoraphidium neglectum]|uniref:Uncharacterized protein n=1 Tax=Monoraphidium neglectum TaxID=145388 RepID=A0A0D2NB19_9CHLO|nr:hypothetical protein MNEG_5268 [Monoraphidium neglectum]KIZ02681.1 hypothetical protein MNEG_5268 [Monoraphidium neglectum]|eukprot:XP_013901700.1 hypothetical protein MNEG_5268 [Monoraphidium neglectum]